MTKPTLKKVLSAELVLEIQNMAANGQSQRGISKWLQSQHGIDYSHISVGKVIRQSLTERRKYSEEILKPYLEKTLLSDLDRLEEQMQLMDKIIAKAIKSGDDQMIIRASNMVNGLITTRRKFCGVEEKKKETTVQTVKFNYEEFAEKYNLPSKKKVNEP